MRNTSCVLVLLLSFLGCALCESTTPPQTPPTIESAVEKQIAATSATTPEERQRLLNEALAVYLSYAKENPSGYLLSNIGDVYSSLGNVGLAIGYYRRAAMQLPRNVTIQSNLQAAVAQANVTFIQQERPLAEFVGLRWCSPLERASIAIGAIAFSFLLFSFNLWLPFVGFRIPWRVSATLTTLLLLFLLSYSLFVPQQAVVIKASPLEPTSAKTPQEAITTVRPGEVVDIVDVEANRGMVHVRTSSHIYGYLPIQTVFFTE